MTTNNEFQTAWVDLGERIAAGVATLETMDLTDRLAEKIAGLSEAGSLYGAIERSPDPDTGGPDGIFGWQWREFTARVFVTYRVTVSARPHFAAGLALALEYQRGYSAYVDALPLWLLESAKSSAPASF